MRYFSTRGGERELSFEEAVLTGLAPDGGLYIPASIPTLPDDWQTTWSSLSFQELSVEVLSLYIAPEEISRDDLKVLVEKSYKNFKHTDVTPLVKLKDDLYVLELWHGPTFAFKDVALQLLGNVFEFFLGRRNVGKKDGEPRERLTIVGATSGDTGSAAIYGLRKKRDTSIFILHPNGRVSPIQEAQMTTVVDYNVHNLAVEGTFDDCQDIVKALFADREFNNQHRLGAINSINWARILAQTVYYFLSYFHVQRSASLGDKKLQYVVPTGNFGDILAGYYAKRMGLPIASLGIATNANDILTRFWKSGRYEKVDSSYFTEAPPPPSSQFLAPPTNSQATLSLSPNPYPDPDRTVASPADGASDGKQSESKEDGKGVKATLSPAMDILVSSNFERLLWYLAYEAAATGERKDACKIVEKWMGRVKHDGRVEVPKEVLQLARRDFVAERISDEETQATILEYYTSKPSYLADPHTAVGLAAARLLAPKNQPNTIQIVLSTAHPAKFSEAVKSALTSQPSFDFERDVLPDEFKGLLEMERRSIHVEAADVDLVKGIIDMVAEKRERDETGSLSV